MLVEDQASTIAFLKDPKTHGVSSSDIVVLETHISIVILAGDRAFKLKRAVRLPYVDLATSARRLFVCHREVELNRQTAPTLYRAVRRITREADGRLVLDGSGPLVDAVVEMTRFDQETLFDGMAARGLLTPPLLTETARTIARFHANAPVVHSRRGSAIMADVIALNEQAFATTDLFSAASVATLNQAFRTSLDRHMPLLDAREQAGNVRRCHGDLHLRNVCLVDGRPTLFDCLEFDEAMATIDVLYDLAFLLMDLWHGGLKAGANLVFNRYLDERNEADGLPLLPFFMAVRAAIRAHVTATQWQQAKPESRDRLGREAQTYLDLANELLAPAPARLIAIGGLSGTGKSTLAAAAAERIGPPPGARVLSSDRIRKRLHAVSAETRLPQEAYSPEVSERVYSTQREEARRILLSGHAVIADAVFDRASDRQQIEQCAADVGVPMAAFWLEAPMDLLVMRVGARRGDPSDATVDIVRAQAAHEHGPIDWIRVPVTDGLESVTARVIDILGDDNFI